MPDSIEAIALRPSIIRKNWLPLKLAVQEVLAFERRFGKKHLLLACHAALPSYLTAELLNLIHLNFLEDEDIPWIAEADFLLSPLCRPVDEHLFEVEPAVREVLLVSLKRQYGNQQGEQRLVDLAAFLQKYLDEKSEQIQRLDVINTLRWIARSYLEPDYVIEELRKQLDESLSTTEDTNIALTNQAELAILLEKIAEPLERSSLQQVYNYLIHDSRVIASQLYADDETPADALSVSPGNSQEGNLTNLVSPALLSWVAASASPVLIPGTIEAPPTPSVTIEREVERLLTLAGWTIQDYAHADIRSDHGVAIRDFPVRTGDIESIDYLLFVDQQAAGVIFVMEEGQNRIGLEEATSLSSRTPMLRGEKPRRDPIPFTYETNAQGTLIRFTSYLDPVTRTRSVFAFHRPETFALWLQQAPPNVAKSRTDLLRARLRRMPSLSREELRDTQYEAITNLEKSLAENRPRALIQMATGNGRTTMMLNIMYRLLKFGNAQRILYLTDRSELIQQMQQVLEHYAPSDDERVFTDIYSAQHLSSTIFYPQASVCVGTVQKIYTSLSKQESKDGIIYKPIISTKRFARSLMKLSQPMQHTVEEKISLLRQNNTHPSLAVHRVLRGKNKNMWICYISSSIRLLYNIQDGVIYLQDIGSHNIIDRLTEGTHSDDAIYQQTISAQSNEVQYNPTLPIDAFDIVVVDEYDTGTIESFRSTLEYFDAFLIGLAEAEDTRILGFFNNNVVYQQPALSMQNLKPVTIFLYYAHQDERIVSQLKNHLSSLERNGLIALRDYGPISPGSEWKQEIDTHLDEAQITLLLISASFLASEYCYSVEMQRAIERHERKEARVIPIILRPVHWNEPPLDKLQALPDRAKPISSWDNRDEGFKNVVDGIARIIEQWNAHSLPGPAAERKALTANLDQLIAAVKMQMQPEPRALATARTLQQLSIFIPNDVTLADLVVGWRTLSHLRRKSVGMNENTLKKNVPNLSLRKAREASGLSQRDVADMLNIPDEKQVSRWERGIHTPRPHYRRALRELYGKSMEELGFHQSEPTDEESAAPIAVDPQPEPFQNLPPSQQEEEPATSQRRVTCNELATMASQFTTEQGDVGQAIKTWHAWLEAFKNSDDPRQAAMARTFARELTELQEALH